MRRKPREAIRKRGGECYDKNPHGAGMIHRNAFHTIKDGISTVVERTTDDKRYCTKVTHPPLKRPSVRHATSIPSPAPMIRLVGLSISGIPVNNGNQGVSIFLFHDITRRRWEKTGMTRRYGSSKVAVHEKENSQVELRCEESGFKDRTHLVHPWVPSTAK